MASSWSKKKREAMHCTLMRQKPDGDNIVKAVLDALLKNDEGIAVLSCYKIWCNEDEAQMQVSLFYL